MPTQLSRPCSLVFALALGALAVLGLLGGVGAVAAAPLAGNLYASPTGGGVVCSAATPCTIQTAVANAATGDTVVVKGGVYVGSGSAVISVTKSITLLGGWDGAAAGPLVRDPAGNPSILDGEGARRVVGISGIVTPTIDGFTIRNGNATGQNWHCTSNAALGCGGGVYAYQARVRLYHNTFINNTGLVTATAYAQGAGGAVYLEQTIGAVISGNQFLNNNASLVYQGIGGGLAIEGGTATTVQANTFNGNGAPTWGGGVALGGNGTALVQRNTFINNVALSGSGFYNWYGLPMVLTNTFTNQYSGTVLYLGFAGGRAAANHLYDNPSAGTGIEVVNGYAGLKVTLVNNIVVNSGATALALSGFNTAPLYVDALHNTLVADHSPGSSGVLVIGGYVTATLTNTLISNAGVGIQRQFPLSGSVKSVYSMYDTNVISLGTASELLSFIGVGRLAIDGTTSPGSAAENSAISSNITTDIFGHPRNQGGVSDIGAVELFTLRKYAPLTVR